MDKIRALVNFKETEGVVPGFVGPSRGRSILVKLHERGVWVKAKGKNGSIFISWDEIYAHAVTANAKERLKARGK